MWRGLTRSHPLRDHTRLHRAAVFAALILIASLLTGCDDQPLPLDDWEDAWRETASNVEQRADPSITVEECEDVLAYLREQRSVLAPVPLEDLETPIDSWFAETESIFFDCDLASATARESLASARALEGEVDVVLSLEG